MNPPQAVSSKYVRNLICNGSNSSFNLEGIAQKIATSPGGVVCGHYYEANVTAKVPTNDMIEGRLQEGATPEQAVTNALHAFGVTFR